MFRNVWICLVTKSTGLQRKNSFSFLFKEIYCLDIIFDPLTLADFVEDIIFHAIKILLRTLFSMRSNFIDFIADICCGHYFPCNHSSLQILLGSLFSVIILRCRFC